MKQIKPKGEWVRSSSTPSRSERLKAHEEFQMSELKKMLDEGWNITKATVKHRRPRIKKEKFKVIITCFGPMKITIEEFNEHCKDFRTVQYV